MTAAEWQQIQCEIKSVENLFDTIQLLYVSTSNARLQHTDEDNKQNTDHKHTT